MSDNTDYVMFMSGEIGDPDYIIFKMFKDVPEAKNFIDENGQSAGNGYDWRSLEQDMRRFSANHPGILFQITEAGTYGGESFEFRHYFKVGGYKRIEPVITVEWPAFAEGMLA